MPYRGYHIGKQDINNLVNLRNLRINLSAHRSVTHKNLIRPLLEYSFAAKQTRNGTETFLLKSCIIINPAGVCEMLEAATMRYSRSDNEGKQTLDPLICHKIHNGQRRIDTTQF